MNKLEQIKTENYKKERLKNSLLKILNDQELKDFIKQSSNILPPFIGDTPFDYLPIAEVEKDEMLGSDPTVKEEIVLREDGFWLQKYEYPYISPFESFEEIKDNFPVGWELRKREKLSVDEIIERFSNLDERRFKRNLSYAISLRKMQLKEYTKEGLPPYYTFSEKMEERIARILSKEIKCLRFLDFFD